MPPSAYCFILLFFILMIYTAIGRYSVFSSGYYLEAGVGVKFLHYPVSALVSFNIPIYYLIIYTAIGRVFFNSRLPLYSDSFIFWSAIADVGVYPWISGVGVAFVLPIDRRACHPWKWLTNLGSTRIYELNHVGRFINSIDSHPYSLRTSVFSL